MSHDDQFHDDFPAELKPIEAALSGLAPAAARLDRDRLMYLAGAAAARESSGRKLSQYGFLHSPIWSLAAAALLFVSIGLGAVLALRQPADRIVYIDRPVAKSEQSSAAVVAKESSTDPFERPVPHTRASADYLVLRDQVLRVGVGALDRNGPAGDTSRHEESHNRAMLRQLLGS